MPKYLFLMRHAKHDGTTLTREGREHTEQVANRFAEVINELRKTKHSYDNIAINLCELWYAGSTEVKATKYALLKIMDESVKGKEEELLHPDEFNAYINSGSCKELAAKIKSTLRDMNDKDALFIIGHQPMLGWIAREFTRQSLPISHSELLCLTFDKPDAYYWNEGYLRWVLSPSDEEAIREIKEKIKYKMEIAKLLSVFITTALGFLLGTLIDENKMKYLCKYEWALYGSVISFMFAIVLYLMTMYSYDRLLMPSRFWADSKPPVNSYFRPKWLVWRPPSSAVWVLYQNMMRIWRYLFTGANVSVGIGLLFLAYAVLKPANPLFSVIGIVVFPLLIFWFYKIFGPKLGTQD